MDTEKPISVVTTSASRDTMSGATTNDPTMFLMGTPVQLERVGRDMAEVLVDETIDRLRNVPRGV